MFAAHYLLLTDQVLSVLVHAQTRRRILVWDAHQPDFEPDYTMEYVYAAFGDSLFVLETGILADTNDSLLTYAALWYAQYLGRSLTYVGVEDPRLQDVG